MATQTTTVTGTRPDGAVVVSTTTVSAPTVAEIAPVVAGSVVFAVNGKRHEVNHY